MYQQKKFTGYWTLLKVKLVYNLNKILLVKYVRFIDCTFVSFNYMIRVKSRTKESYYQGNTLWTICNKRLRCVLAKRCTFSIRMTKCSSYYFNFFTRNLMFQPKIFKKILDLLKVLTLMILTHRVYSIRTDHKDKKLIIFFCYSINIVYLVTIYFSHLDANILREFKLEKSVQREYER